MQTSFARRSDGHVTVGRIVTRVLARIVDADEPSRWCPYSRLGGADAFGSGLARSEATATGTPAYVYDLDAIAAEARALARGLRRRAAPRRVRREGQHARAPSSAPLAAEGCGADVVSGAELLVALACGVAPEQIVYSGVAKTDDELDRAIGRRGHRRDPGRERRGDRARRGARARAAGSARACRIRVNPGGRPRGARRTRTSRPATTRRSSASPRDDVAARGRARRALAATSRSSA